MAAQIKARIPLKYCHLANSAASLEYNIPSNNLCRPGLVLYGFSPIETPAAEQLRPAMALFSRLTVVRTLPEGHGISYGGTFVTKHPTRVATVGIGYADGYLRSLAGKGTRIVVDGVSCPLLGRVTMDQIIVDVSHVPHAEPGMTVEIMGPHIPVTELAEKAGTIPWEIFTGIGPRVPRHYTF
jgi:alanine racemase